MWMWPSIIAVAHPLPGVATMAVGIPSMYEDRYLVVRCLKSIAEQTVLPEEVVVHMSHVPSEEDSSLRQRYAHALGTIPLTFSTVAHLQLPNAARNEVAARVTAKWIAFVDGDDLMHPQRLEVIALVIRLAPSDFAMALHGYVREIYNPPLFNMQHDVVKAIVDGDTLVKKRLGNDWNDGYKVTPACKYTVTNGHPTVRTTVYTKYNQTWARRTGEDQVFIHEVFLGLKKTSQVAYVDLPLTLWFERAKRCC